jgi:4-amino-4-deoxy-L-arabinose transferase-like glycosyltransferase
MSRWFFLALVVLFLAGHAVCRCLTYAHLEYDEAEQLTLVQTLSLGYYYQPPLFTWLLWPLVQIFGPTVYPLLILRTILFALIFLLAYRVAIRLCADRTTAGLAGLALVLVPEIFHGAIGMWTHTSLLLMFTLATLLVVLRLREQPTTWDYFWLGLCGGLGLLAKYNYAHFAAALVLAMAITPAWRRLLIDRRMVLSLAIAGLLIAPHAWWALEHAEEVRHGVLRYTEIRQDQLEGWQGTLKHLSVNLVQNFGRSFGFVLVPLVLLILPAWRQAAREEGQEERCLLLHLFLAAAVLLALVMIFGGVRHLRQHWLTPFAVLLAPLLLSRIDPTRLAAWRLRGLQAVLILVVFGALVWRGTLVVRNGSGGRLNARDYLYAAQAEQLRIAGWDEAYGLAEHPYTAGYLRLHFPQARIRCAYFPSHVLPEGDVESVLVSWIGSATEGRRFRRLTALVPAWISTSELPEEGVVTLQEDTRLPESGRTVLRSLIISPGKPVVPISR